MQGEITLRQALEEYINVFMPFRNYSKRTRVEYANDLKDLVSFIEKLAGTRVEELTLPRIERYIANLEKQGLALVTRKRKIIAIRSFCSFLYINRYLLHNLAKHIIPPRIDTASPRFLTEAEYSRLLTASSSSKRDYAIIQLLLQTGIRLSELTRLLIHDVELPPVIEKTSTGYLHVKASERQKERIIPVNSKACSTLKAYIGSRYAADDQPLFINRFRKRLGARGVEKILAKYMEEASIEGASVESLRHTFGAHHIAKGTSLKTVQEVMGHRDPRTTETYISLAKQIAGREMEENAL